MINMLSAVVVPLTSKELLKLEILFSIWRIWELVNPGTRATPNKKLIVSLDCEYSKNIDDQVNHLFMDYRLGSLFSEIRILFCAIPCDENVYIKANEAVPPKIPRLGYASGPNNQFFRTMRFLKCENYVLLNETDCVPCRYDWLEMLGKRVYWNEHFWIMGSSYKGINSIRADISNHINGNAIYAVGADGFQSFLDEWEDTLEEAVKTRRYMAYDVFLAYWESAISMSSIQGSGLETSEMRVLRTKKKLFVYTDMIHNCSAKEDIENSSGSSLAGLSMNKDLCLTHGRQFIIQSMQYGFSQLLKKSTYLDKNDRLIFQTLKEKTKGGEHDAISNVLADMLLAFNSVDTTEIKSISNVNTGKTVKSLKTYMNTTLIGNDKVLAEENIIFLLGNPRSGTTMLQKTLSTSNDIATCGEPWIQLYLRGLLIPNLSQAKFDASLMRDALHQVEIENNIPRHLENVIHDMSLHYYSKLRNSINPSATYFLDKTPRYSLICDSIVAQHPNARYIVLLRNPFDIACSVISTWTNDLSVFMTSSALRLDFEAGLVKLCDLAKKPPANCLICTYEEIIENPEMELGRIADFLLLKKNGFSLDYSSSARQFKFGDSKMVHKESRPVKNKDSWRDALKTKDEYDSLCSYMKNLPSHVLKTMNYNPHTWSEDVEY